MILLNVRFVHVDFDEQTTDDWEVDMSEYYEAGTGDKDARDYIKMRKEQRARDDLANLEELSSFDKAIGAFEKHTRVRGWYGLYLYKSKFHSI